jgi:tetratricopeptide (TPR) repeat protein
MDKEKHMEPEFEEEEIEEEISRAHKAKAGRKKKKKPSKPKGGEPLQPSTIFYLHSLLLFGGRLLSGVLDFYNNLFDLTPGDKTKIYRNISAHYAKKGMHEKGLHYLKEWARLDPTNPDSHYQLGIALAESGNLKSAIGVFDKVLKLKSDHKGAIYRKSRVYLKLKDYKSATEGLEQLLKLIPDNPKALYLLGIAYDRMEEVDKAIQVLQKAVELEPEEIKYHQHLGFLYERKEDHKQAAKCFSRVMELEREQDEEEY